MFIVWCSHSIKWCLEALWGQKRMSYLLFKHAKYSARSESSVCKYLFSDWGSPRDLLDQSAVCALAEAPSGGCLWVILMIIHSDAPMVKNHWSEWVLEGWIHKACFLLISQIKTDSYFSHHWQNTSQEQRFTFVQPHSPQCWQCMLVFCYLQMDQRWTEPSDIFLPASLCASWKQSSSQVVPQMRLCLQNRSMWPCFRSNKTFKMTVGTFQCAVRREGMLEKGFENFKMEVLIHLKYPRSSIWGPASCFLPGSV